MISNFMNYYQVGHMGQQTALYQGNYPQQSSYGPVLTPNQNFRQSNLLTMQGEVVDKYKTELCKNWEKIGTCPYGEKCRFAHGKYDLKLHQLQQENSNYKSKDCLSYFNHGTCNYGLRCLFKHDERSFAEIQLEFIILQRYYGNKNKSKRLPVFEEVAPLEGNDYASDSTSDSYNLCSDLFSSSSSSGSCFSDLMNY